MEHIRAINALEPFVLLSKSANSPRGAADLITQATSSPNTFVFAELLQTPNIQALRNSQPYGSYLKLLEIFCWGSYADFREAEPDLPNISSLQLQKLQLLSLPLLASEHSPLPYSILQSALSLSDEASLESLVTTAIASSLLKATLDPYAKLIYIDSVAPLRDLAPGRLPNLISVFTAWSTQCTSILSDIEAQQTRIYERAQQKADRQQRIDDLFDQKLKDVAEEDRQGKGKRVLDEKDNGPSDEDAMDIDGDGEEASGRAKGGKRVLKGMLAF